MADNVKKIQAAVRENENMDALLITSFQNRFYSIGFASSAGEIVISGDDAVLFIDARYYEEACELVKSARVELMANRRKSFEVLSDYMQKHGIKKLGIEERSLTYSQYCVYANNLPVELVAGESILGDLRASKSREELQILIDAERIAEVGYKATIPLISKKMTEKDLYRELQCQILRAGADDKAFGPIVVSGSHTSIPHGQADNRQITDGFLTLDFGAKYNGYNSDITRTLCIGDPSKEMEKVYNVVLDSQMEAIKAAKAGMTGKELDGVARNVIADAGYGEYFTHSLSHGVGIDLHEAPNASVSAVGILPVGSLISIEPGIYLPGKFGVRIEDSVYLTEDGCEDITDLPKELTVISE